MDERTLRLLKYHMRVDDIADPAAEGYYEFLYEGCKQEVLHYINRTEDEVVALAGGEFPSDLLSVIFALCADKDNNREASSAQSLGSVPVYQAILKHWEKLSDRTEQDGSEGEEDSL